MNDQKKNEIIKALAYGRTPEEIADAEDVTLQEVLDIQSTNDPEITETRAELEKGGFINGNDL